MKRITSKSYLAMLEHGVYNLAKNKTMLNDLNVFPVPDGDTGTNMFMTLKYAFDNLTEKEGTLEVVAKNFASLSVFGARGNSGVILSQFIKGIADGLAGCVDAGVEELIVALEKGCGYAYSSVAKPVEGTMLTVIRESVEAIKKKREFESVKDLIFAFVKNAKISLEDTPNRLPILKKAGVVDSGGCGIVCFFEGILAFLEGRAIEIEQNEEQVAKALDFSMINKDTPFNYGYCIEGLLQLKVDVKEFEIEKFLMELTKKGRSVVATLEKDKVKLHVHAKALGKIMDFCQKFGEFLTIKIENMSVQNLQKDKEKQKKFLTADEQGEKFNVVAVATNPYLQNKFLEMGADVVILSDMTPSSQDFIDAFALTSCKEVLVFPNSANSILTAIQASSFCENKKISILNSRSVAECFSALSIIDFDSMADDAVSTINQTIKGLRKVFVYHSSKSVEFGDVKVSKNDFFSLENNEKIYSVGQSLEDVVLQTIKKTTSEKACSLLTVFYAGDIAEEYVVALHEKIQSLGLDIEISTVCTMESSYSLVLMFE